MEEVVIPDRIGKSLVTHIATPDFSKRVFPSYVKKVTIQEGLLSIGSRVFLTMGNDFEVSIPDSVLVFEQDTFGQSFLDNVEQRFEKIGSFYYRKKGMIRSEGKIIIDGVLCGLDNISPFDTVWKIPNEMKINILTKSFPYLYYRESECEDNNLDFSKVKKGDQVLFGHFPQDYEGNIKPIEWKVIKIVDGKMLLHTVNILAPVPYNREWEPTSWRESSIRKWLNEAFYDCAFNESEKKNIIESENEIDTYDKVFLLSADEIKGAFPNKKYNLGDYGIRIPNSYSLAREMFVRPKIKSGYWWLREVIENQLNKAAAVITPEGGYDLGKGNMVTANYGICPAIWVKI